MRPLLCVALALLAGCGGSKQHASGPRRSHAVAPCHPPLKKELARKLAKLHHLECTLEDKEAGNDFCDLTLYPPDAIACLAELVDDTTPLPKEATLPMVPHAYVVGDAAVLLAVHLLEATLQDVLPPELEQRFGDEGMKV